MLRLFRKRLPDQPRSGWRVMESFSGAWQRNIEIRRDDVIAYWAVYACVRLISCDVGKMGLGLQRKTQHGTWEDVPGYSPYRDVLERPNRYQTPIQFLEYWTTSKLFYGNTYAIKVRDSRGIVKELHILHPNRVRPLVSPDGSVFYELDGDDLGGVGDQVVVPASEIIHDRMTALHHPLIGVSPIYASGVAAMHGLAIQNSSANFFAKGAMPSGILTAPGAISNDDAKEIKNQWEVNYSGNNAGRVAILGDGMQYEPMTITAADSQMIEQLKMTAIIVASTYGVPPHKIGIGEVPAYNNAAIMDQQYYSQCLQSIIENTESALCDGLGLGDIEGRQYRIELDIQDLIRLDPEARYKSHGEAIRGGWMSPNEARIRENMAPVAGGDSPMIQQQNYSLAAIAARDERESVDDTGDIVSGALEAISEQA